MGGNSSGTIPIKVHLEVRSYGTKTPSSTFPTNSIPPLQPRSCAAVSPFSEVSVPVFGLTNSGTAMALYGLRSTHRVGIIGIGGLGHLAIQFASKMGCQVVAFSGTESKRAEAMGFGAVEFHATRGLTEFKGVKPLDQLLITTSEQPDFGLYLQCSPCPCFLAPPSVLNSLLVLRLIGGEGI
jgi:NADPH:quinone reductase-like Zn-dependent oxidoreductase